MAETGTDRIVVVGGGIIGAAVAFHALRAGHPDVLLIDAGRVGGGATGAATGGIRCQFTSQANIELAARSIPFWVDFEARTGHPLDFRQHGYLFVLSRADELATFTAGMELQRSLGVDVELLDAAAVGDLVPGIRTDDVLGGTFTPHDGSASPTAALAGLLAAARADGLVVEEGVEFRGLERASDGSVTGVLTSQGRRAGGTVVLAAGPQSRHVAAQCGVVAPVSSRPRQAFLTARNDLIPDGLPLVVDMESGAYLNPSPESGRVVVGGSDMAAPAARLPGLDWDRSKRLVQALDHRFPAWGEIRFERGWSGLREMTPDGHPLIGPVDGVPGLWLVAGFSGHGFMQAPRAGELVAQWILHGAPDCEVAALRPGRFTSLTGQGAENAAF